MTDIDQIDLDATDVAWDLEPLLEGRSIDDLLDDARVLGEELATLRGTVASLTATELARAMSTMDQIHDRLGRAHGYAGLRFSENTADPANGAQMQFVSEKTTEIAKELIFFDLEWAAIPDEQVATILSDPALEFCRHHLDGLRRYRPHLLTEPEERILADKDVTGSSAWGRLFSELTSAITVTLPTADSATGSPDHHEVSLEEGLSQLAHPDRSVRQAAARAVTEALQPGIRTRAFIFNTLLADKSTDDRLRTYDTWVSSRNLSNEASDASVDALIDAVVARYDIARRWYRLKADILGLDQLADYDRMASVADSETRIGWGEARDLVLDSYASFSPELADAGRRFFDEGWIDAPIRPGKRPGAFCAYTVSSHHPYLFLNWTGRQRDALTLAHELGHGLHAYLARPQGNFHQSTPLTLAETASVFGETVTFGRLLDQVEDPAARLALLAQSVEGNIATVFRQVAMNRFEAAVHTHRRQAGELSVDDFGDAWATTQSDLLGDAVDVTDDYRSWWSYIPHFIGTPGYVYAYAYGQLLALSVYQRYQERGDDFVPDYLALLRAGGSQSPGELAAIVDCDLEDPGFWDAGLDLVEAQLNAATDAAITAGRIER